MVEAITAAGAGAVGAVGEANVQGVVMLVEMVMAMGCERQLDVVVVGEGLHNGPLAVAVVGVAAGVAAATTIEAQGVVAQGQVAVPKHPALLRLHPRLTRYPAKRSRGHDRVRHCISHHQAWRRVPATTMVVMVMVVVVVAKRRIPWPHS